MKHGMSASGKLALDWNAFLFLVSTCIRSMWGAICDAKAYRKCDGKFCAQNPQFTPKLEFGSRSPPTPTLTDPWKLKFMPIMALRVFDFPIHHTPTPMHLPPHWNLGRSSGGCSMWRLNRCIPQGYHLVFMLLGDLICAATCDSRLCVGAKFLQ